MNRHRRWESPVGVYCLVVDEQARLAGVYLAGQRHLPPDAFLGACDNTIADDVTGQLEEYFAGTRQEFAVALAPRGTDFQREVWGALREVDYGKTTTYGLLAQRIGRPGASRAVGAATGRNPWSVIVPCHRLVGNTGALTGYAGGLATKQFLLALEAGDDSAPRP